MSFLRMNLRISSSRHAYLDGCHEEKQPLSDSNSELEHTKAAKPESREPQGPEHKVTVIDMK